MAEDKEKNNENLLTQAEQEFVESFKKDKQAGKERSQADHDKFIGLVDTKPSDMANYVAINELNDILSDPRMIQRAQDLQRAGKIVNSLEIGVGLFQDAYNYRLAREQQRVGQEELDSIVEPQVPGKVQAIPELEDALRRARGLGDPSLALKTYQDAAERAQLGSVRAAQLGSRGQAGALGAQAQAIHQLGLQNALQLPAMAQQIKAQGLQAEAPFIAQKQAIEEANRAAQLETFPQLLGKNILEQQMAGRTVAMGQQAAQNVIAGLPSRIPTMARNLYSDKYSDLPEGIAGLLRNYEPTLTFGK